MLTAPPHSEYCDMIFAAQFSHAGTALRYLLFILNFIVITFITQSEIRWGARAQRCGNSIFQYYVLAFYAKKKREKESFRRCFECFDYQKHVKQICLHTYM